MSNNGWQGNKVYSIQKIFLRSTHMTPDWKVSKMCAGFLPCSNHMARWCWCCGGEGVVALWCNPLTLQPQQSRGVGSNPSRAPPLKCHGKGSRNRLSLLYFCDPSAWH